MSAKKPSANSERDPGSGTVGVVVTPPEGNNTTLAAQLPGIFAGLSYINFHTIQFTGGEIRGQILQVAEPDTLSLLGIGFLAFAFINRHVFRLR